MSDSWFEIEKLRSAVSRIKSDCASRGVPSTKLLTELENRANSCPRASVSIDKNSGNVSVKQVDSLVDFVIGPSAPRRCPAHGAHAGVRLPIRKGSSETFVISAALRPYSVSASAKAFSVCKGRTNFDRQNPFVYDSAELLGRIENLKGMRSKHYEFILTKNSTKRDLEGSLLFSFVDQRSDRNSPLPLKYEPDAYVTMSGTTRYTGNNNFIPEFTLGAISEKDVLFNPYFLFKLRSEINLPFDMRFSISCGMTQSLRAKKNQNYGPGKTLPLPYPMKFHIGGVRSAPGIHPGHFGYSFGSSIPMGSDVFLTTSLLSSTKKYTPLNLQSEFFITNTIAKNFSSYCINSLDRDATLSCVAGWGFKYEGKWTFYANTQIPILQQGAENDFYAIQFGIVSNTI